MRSFLSPLAISSIAALSIAGAAQAQPAASDYPRKPVRLVVPFAAGGALDVITRSVTPKMSENLGQQILVDNRGGAGTTIGTEIVARSPPDGYTLLMVGGSHVTNPAMVRKLPYDSIRDFAGITIVAEVPSALLVHPSLPVKNVKGLMALAKARPGEITYATPGRGTLAHLAIEWLSSMGGVKMVTVPYKGAGPALIDLMAGHVELLFTALPGVVQQTRDGKVRMIAQTAGKRSASMPDVPTVEESGYPGFLVSSHFGLLVPAGTPRPVIDRVRGAVLEALGDAAVLSRLAALGAERVGSTPEEQEALIRSEIAKWIKVARGAGIDPL